MKDISSKYLKVCLSVFFSLFFLLQTTVFAEDFTFDLLPGLNGISLPYEGTNINNAEDLCTLIPFCESVAYWDVSTQSLVSHTIGSAVNNFQLTPGSPYFVTVSQATNWTVSGNIPSYYTVPLNVTNTTDVNTIALPLGRRLYLTTAEELVNDIPNSDTVWFWDEVIQGYVGHPKGTPINNFPVYPGHPYFVNVTSATTWLVDDSPPSIAITHPAEGVFINTITPVITVSFNDTDSGIDITTFTAKINGADSTSLFTVTNTQATYSVTSPLPVGNNTINTSISDKAGNNASSISNFRVGVLRAIPGATPATGGAPLTVYFSTGGEDPAGTIEVFRWDFDGNGSWDTYDTVARDYNHTYNSPGTYNAILYVKSSTGESDTKSIAITVENNPPVATANIIPSNGPIPLNVSMIGSGSDSDGTIVLYEWDFNGDGVYDWSSPTSGTTSHTYTEVGTFQAVFRVTDNNGLKSTANAVTTAVRAAPPGAPTATASASPTNGNAPLNVNFSGTAIDPNNDVVLYEWDFDNDGVYDWSSPSNGTTSHTYNTAGTHVASFRVTDSTGFTGIDQTLISVDIQVSLSIAKDTVGFLPGTNNGLTASASSQYSSSYPPSRAIDDNTGTFWFTCGYCVSGSWFEVQFATPQRVAGFTITWYDSSYYKMSRARIEALNNIGDILYTEERDFSGSTSQVNLPNVENVTRIRLTTINYSSSSYIVIREFAATSTPMPTAGGPEPTGTNINTSISAATQVSVFIKDSDGNTVRTLVNNEQRDLGAYSDYWDVKDDNGIVLNDGIYYALLQYIVDGQVKTYDLTDNTGGTRNTIRTGSRCDQRNTVRSNFTPYEDDFLPLTFRLCKSQEVTAFIGPLWSGGSVARIRTILNRKILPAGSHTIYWDGLDDNGNIAHPPPGDRLITGFWRYTLPNNAIYVTGGSPVISGVSSDPNYFTPLSRKCSANGNSVAVTYTVSEDVATIELRIISIDTKNTVRVINQNNVIAGVNKTYWNGQNNNGQYVAAGDYQLALDAIDADGNRSLLTYVNLVRISY